MRFDLVLETAEFGQKPKGRLNFVHGDSHIGIAAQQTTLNRMTDTIKPVTVQCVEFAQGDRTKFAHIIDAYAAVHNILGGKCLGSLTSRISFSESTVPTTIIVIGVSGDGGKSSVGIKNKLQRLNFDVEKSTTVVIAEVNASRTIYGPIPGVNVTDWSKDFLREYGRRMKAEVAKLSRHVKHIVTRTLPEP